MILDGSYMLVNKTDAITGITGGDIIGYLDLRAGFENMTHLYSGEEKGFNGKMQPRTLIARVVGEFDSDIATGALELVNDDEVTFTSPDILLDTDDTLYNFQLDSAGNVVGAEITGINGWTAPLGTLKRYLGIRAKSDMSGTLTGGSLEVGFALDHWHPQGGQPALAMS